MRHFAAGCDLIADAVWIDVFDFGSIFGRNYGIMRMNDLPDAGSGAWSFLAVYKPALDF